MKFFCRRQTRMKFYKTIKLYSVTLTIRRLSALIYGLILLCSIAAAQNLPDEIRGYKVYQAKVSVKTQTSENTRTAANQSELFVKIGEPELVKISLTGVTFELSAEINALNQSGRVDFITFKDFRINDLIVSIEEYKESFEIKKNQPTILPQPVKILVGAKQTLRGALEEFRDSKQEWTVTGTVFVFGHFKKSFLKFKRVVPIQVNLKIKNPLAAGLQSQKQISLLTDKKLNNFFSRV